MEVKIIKQKKPGYRLKIFGAVIRRKGRLLADLTNDIEFKEENQDGSYKVYTR